MHKKYEYWLAAIPGLANGSKQMLREHMKSAERAYYIEETALQKLDFLTEKDREILRRAKKKYNPEEICEELETKQIQVAIYFEETYPSRLKMIADNPYAIISREIFRMRNNTVSEWWGRVDVLHMGKRMRMNMQKYCPNSTFRLSADWREELTESVSAERWSGEVKPSPSWEMAWISVIHGRTAGCTAIFWQQAAESCRNFRRGLRRCHISFRGGTELSADCPILCL